MIEVFILCTDVTFCEYCQISDRCVKGEDVLVQVLVHIEGGRGEGGWGEGKKEMGNQTSGNLVPSRLYSRHGPSLT